MSEGEKNESSSTFITRDKVYFVRFMNDFPTTEKNHLPGQIIGLLLAVIVNDQVEELSLTAAAFKYKNTQA